MGVVSGSLGITGSATLNIEMTITGSTITNAITGSFRIYEPSIVESGSSINITGGSSTKLINGVDGEYIKVHTVGYAIYSSGIHLLYFGTSTTPTTKRMLTASGSGVYHQTFVSPRISDSGDSLYIYSENTETTIPCDVTYVQE